MPSGSRRPHHIDAGPAGGAATDVVGNRLPAPIDRSGCPARHVRRHHDVRQFVERELRGQDAGMAGGGIAVPGVDDGAGDATVAESLVQRSLIDRGTSSDVQYYRRRAHRRKGRGVHHADRLGIRRHRDHKEVRRAPEFARLFKPNERSTRDDAGTGLRLAT